MDCFTIQLKDTCFYQEVWQEGYDVGYQEGYEQGLKEAKEKRERLLKRHLVKRFGELPETIQQRLEKADAGQLGDWLAALVNATSLDAVFKDNELANDGNE